MPHVERPAGPIAALRAWQEAHDEGDSALAVDGKTIRGTIDDEGCQMHVRGINECVGLGPRSLTIGREAGVSGKIILEVFLCNRKETNVTGAVRLKPHVGYARSDAQGSSLNSTNESKRH